MTVMMMGLAHPHEKPTGKDNKNKARAGETMGRRRRGRERRYSFLREKKKKGIGSGALFLTGSNRGGGGQGMARIGLFFSPLPVTRGLRYGLVACFSPSPSDTIWLTPRCLKCANLHARSSELEVLGRLLALAGQWGPFCDEPVRTRSSHGG